MTKVLVPELGDGITKVTVAFWHVRVGDQVLIDDDIVELVTDKATFNVPAHCPGVIKEILIKEGQETRIGEVLAVIDPK